MNTIKNLLYLLGIIVILFIIVMSGFYLYSEQTGTAMNPTVFAISEGIAAVLMSGLIAIAVGFFLPFIAVTAGGFTFPLLKQESMVAGGLKNNPLMQIAILANLQLSQMWTFWPKSAKESTIVVYIKVLITIFVLSLIPIAAARFLITTPLYPIWAKWIGGLIGSLVGIGIGILVMDEIM